MGVKIAPMVQASITCKSCPYIDFLLEERSQSYGNAQTSEIDKPAQQLPDGFYPNDSKHGIQAKVHSIPSCRFQHSKRL